MARTGPSPSALGAAEVLHSGHRSRRHRDLGAGWKVSPLGDHCARHLSTDRSAHLRCATGPMLRLSSGNGASPRSFRWLSPTVPACSASRHSAARPPSIRAIARSLDSRRTASDSDRPRLSRRFRRSKTRGFDPHVMAVCSAHPTPPLVPLSHPVVELARRSLGCGLPPWRPAGLTAVGRRQKRAVSGIQSVPRRLLAVVARWLIQGKPNRAAG